MDQTFSLEEFARLRAFLQVAPTSTTPLMMSQTSHPPAAPVPPISQTPLQNTATQPLPITQLYQSSRQQPPPQGLTTTAPAMATRFQPYPGIGTLGLNLATGHANQARMASASATIPRQAQLPRRSRRTRGPAQSAPVLPQSRKPVLNDCLATPTTIRLRFFVYPPRQKNKQQYMVYRFFKDSFENWMGQHELLYSEEVDLSVPFPSVVSGLIAKMESSSMQFQFSQYRHSSLVAPHENLPIQLLRPVRGTRSVDGRVLLRPEPISSTATLGDVVRDFFGLGSSIDGDRFILRFVIRTPSLFYIKDGRKHGCLARHFYRCFQDDGHTAGPSRGGSEDDDDSSGGESMAATDDGSDVEVSQRLLPNGNDPQSLRSEPSINTIMTFLPPRIWYGAWSQRRATVSQPSYSIAEFASRVYSRDFPKLVVEGSSIQDLVRAYDTILTDAVKTNDFTRLLASEREFNLNNSRSRLFSFGPGIEREVIFTTFCGYLIEPSRWFLPLVDNAASLQTSVRFFLSRSVDQDQLERVKKLGALCALLLINGQCPEPFNPLIFQYIINDCDLQSLHEHLVGEWHPDLRTTIRQWIDMGETGDVTPFRSHFASFHNQSLGIFRNRNKEMHDKIGAEMLYSAILGPEPPSHPEWMAFRTGFSLPCSNGFNFFSIPKLFQGGSESFFSLLWTSKVTGFDSIRARLSFLRPSDEILQHLEAATGQAGISVASLFARFLQGSGIPCCELFDAVKAGFSPLIDLSEIDSNSFRSRIFVWAVTGCPHLDPASDPIVIGIVPEDDQLYASNPAQATMMAAQGKISFRTCLQAARLPASHILSLATSVYPPTSSFAPQNFQQAFDHWLLCELLNGIGGISML